MKIANCGGNYRGAYRELPREKLILASRSPRRRELLIEAGYEFEVVVPNESAECGVCSRESPEQLVARLAWQKAADVAVRIGCGLVIGCDTVVECDGKILGKPANEDHARQDASGAQRTRTPRAFSGFAWPGAGRYGPQVRVAVTRLRMDRLREGEIDEYVASGLWEGKAGRSATRTG